MSDREKFEAYFKGFYGEAFFNTRPWILDKRHNGEYEYPHPQEHWNCWQKARAEQQDMIERALCEALQAIKCETVPGFTSDPSWNYPRFIDTLKLIASILNPKPVSLDDRQESDSKLLSNNQ